MDRLSTMALLLAVTEAGSLSAAARRSGMPLATVSRRISDLEAHLKVRLLDRSSRRVRPTDAGQAYLAACRRVLEEVAEAERAASGEYRAARGELIVSAPVVLGRLHVLPVAIAFLEAYPEIDLRIVLSDRVVNLLEEPIDAAVRIGALADSSLIAARVGRTRRVVAASPHYLAARRHPEDLSGHDCVTFDWLMGSDAWSFATAKGDLSVAIRSRLVVNTAEAAIDAAIGGLGITRVLSYQIAGAVRERVLEILLRSFEAPPSPINLIYAGQRLMPLKLRAFLDFTAPRLRARLADRPD